MPREDGTYDGYQVGDKARMANPGQPHMKDWDITITEVVDKPGQPRAYVNVVLNGFDSKGEWNENVTMGLEFHEIEPIFDPPVDHSPETVERWLADA